MRMKLREIAALALAAAVAMPLTGCAVGPDFVRPPVPALKRYTAKPTPKNIESTTGEPSQQLDLAGTVSTQWWALFRSSALAAAVDHALQANQTLAAARATLRAAQQTAAAARGAWLPQIDISASADRQASPSYGPSHSGAGASVSNLYAVGAAVSYAPDVFGATRRQVERQEALADMQRYQLAAAYLTLTGNVASQAIAIASLRAQLQITREVIAGDRQTLSLVRQAFDAGKVPRTDVLTAQTQLASDRTALPTLQQQLSSARHALAVLTGRAPAAWFAPPFDLADFTLPTVLPVSLPSQLVRQRPDILAAQARLHADSAAIGVATAQLFPSITLSASAGQQSLNADTLFSPAGRFWNLSAGLLGPLFHGNTLRAQRRAAIATYQASLATYRQTVLEGFQQVADTLRALVHDTQWVDAESEVVDAARESLALQQAGYAAGKTTILSLIDARRAYLQARLGFARARSQRLDDSAQLLVALGGGWWKNRSL